MKEYLQVAFRQIAERVQLHSLLCDPKISELCRFWTMYAGQHEDVIRHRAEELGVFCSPEMLSDLMDCLATAYSRAKGGGSYGTWAEHSTFESYFLASPNSELRCRCCGYWFGESDLGKRRSLCSDLGYIFSSAVDPRREGDDLKPLSIEGKDRVLTLLEIDHIRPRAGLGSDDISNLGILCRLCNEGKSHFIQSSENISLVVANSLITTYPIVGSPRLKVPAVYAALRGAEQKCSRCGLDTWTTELTVAFKNRQIGHLVPWDLNVLCYDCYATERVNDFETTAERI